MVLSMTGFGKAVGEYNGKRFTVEVKSLNSKQLDLFMRWPSMYKEKELDARTLVANALHRGKIDFMLTIESLDCNIPTKVNVNVLKSYKMQISAAAEELGVSEPQDWMPMLMRLPDVLQADSAELDEKEIEALMDTINRALEELISFRKREGKTLQAVFEKNLNAITDLLAQVEPFEKERVENIRTRLKENLESIGSDYDKKRFEEEIFYYIEKLDINEEKNRLRAHIAHFFDTMNSKDDSVGKSLGFLAQELGREINTLGSKSNQAEMQVLVVKMKDELEQIKEQVLNVL